MHSIRQLVQLSTDFLTKKGVVDARLSAEELLAFVLKQKRLDLYLDYDAPVIDKEVDTYRTLIQKRSEGQPLGYLLGSVEFMGCRLTLTPAVLIPRQETEILLDLALKEIPNEPRVLWDICCGSGCLGLGAKKHRPELKVTLADLSPDALSCAKQNAETNDLEVECLLGDLLEPFSGRKADIIFCNPPYIDEETYAELEREVHFEPKMALTAGDRGLAFYKRLAKELPHFLAPGAKVFLEVGYDQGAAMNEIFNQSHWKQRRCEKDWAGSDRFFFLEFRSESF